MTEAMKLLGEAYKELVDYLGPQGGIQNKILDYLRDRSCEHRHLTGYITICCDARKILEDIEGPPMDWDRAEKILKEAWWSDCNYKMLEQYRFSFLSHKRTRELYDSIMRLDK